MSLPAEIQSEIENEVDDHLEMYPNHIIDNYGHCETCNKDLVEWR
jgi:hypothetical protein